MISSRTFDRLPSPPTSGDTTLSESRTFFSVTPLDDLLGEIKLGRIQPVLQESKFMFYFRRVNNGD